MDTDEPPSYTDDKTFEKITVSTIGDYDVFAGRPEEFVRESRSFDEVLRGLNALGPIVDLRLEQPIYEVGDSFKATVDTVFYTRQSAWRATVIPTETPALKVFRGMPDQSLPTDQDGMVMVPWDAFTHTQVNAWIGLEADLPNGKPLPEWITLDRRTGYFTFRPPAGFKGEFTIRLKARDTTGLEAVTLFKLRIGEKPEGNQARDTFEMPGRSSLAEQLRDAARQRQTGLAAHRTIAPVPLTSPASRAVPRAF